MIHTEDMTDQEIAETAMQLLARELGPMGYIRFVQQIEAGTGDYTEDRHAWLDDLTWEDIRAGLEKARCDLAGMGLTAEPIAPEQAQ